MRDVTGFLKQQQSNSATPGLASEWHALEDLYAKKLWHQLTLKLRDFVKDPCFKAGDGLIQLYENFLCDFEHRINPLSLVEIVLYVARQMSDPKDSIPFLEKTIEKVKSSEEAVILCKTSIGSLKLQIDDLPATKKLIEEVDEMLDKLPGVTSVHGDFYDLSSKYYWIVSDHAGYYKDALRYLGCVDLNDLPDAEKQERAFKLGRAGLMGDGVYNFGELLMHPVLQTLRNCTDRRWLVETLSAFNGGNVEKFQSFRSAWGQQADLAAREAQLTQKLRLLCVMEMTFACPANHRTLAFQDIAQSAQIPVEEVELLVMKALAAGLIRGNIDQVEQKVQMTWVQPRVLDTQQIRGMEKRLNVWCGDVKNMATLVEKQAHDILT